ncbi:hypothetical protein [Spirochaeta lutea]|uniref:Lipoprotein n=1 Tax=Spirochaeta lutea TaxID=1480694 RepID=A0A098QUC8_9SPIO|nr:hypothetical protein [Spirochaeta lutea]KGE71450.1 hypothetical protein DC28_11745 [Spirochaeta lutea]
MNTHRTTPGWVTTLGTIALLAITLTGCASRVTLDRWDLPDTALRTVTLEFDPPDAHHNPKGEMGVILAIAASVAETVIPMNIDTEAIEAEARIVNQSLQETLTWDLELPLLPPVDSRTSLRIESGDGSWVHTTAYRYESRPEADLSVAITLSYERTGTVPFGVDEAAVGIGMVYPKARLDVTMTDRRGDTLWRDHATYRSDQAIPFGSLSVFGVEMVREYDTSHSFVSLVDQALYKLVDRTLHW